MSTTESEKAEIKPEDWTPLVPSIFARCVAGEGVMLRYDMTRPVVIGDRLYASDARIAARIAVPPGWDIPNAERAFLKVHTAFEGQSHAAAPTPIPEVDGVCDECHGARVLPARVCPQCHGARRCRAEHCDCPECDGYHECDLCDGKGQLPAGRCFECYGTGVPRPGSRHPIADGFWIGRGYASLLREHGAEVFLPEPPTHTTPVRFVVGEVEGRLMGMTPPAPGEED